MPHLSIHILCQTAHVREVEYHFVKVSLLDYLSSSTAFGYSWFPKLCRVNAMKHCAILLGLEDGDIGCCLGIFGLKRGGFIVASGNHASAGVAVEKGAGE